MTEIASRLLDWFDLHGRKDLPWQQSSGAYGVWISEIMLQQTQVQTVVPYYERFMRRFPSVAALAEAELDEVLQHWSGLGYYARARNLHKAARQIRDSHAGEYPTAFDEVLSLPGVGRSTAGAVMALAFGERFPILDGNVKRVLARHAAIEGWPGKSRVQSTLWALADKHTPSDRIGDYTQAIMDLGATVCTRSSPRCEACPLREDCVALLSNTAERYPGRKPRQVKPRKQTTMLLAVVGDAVYLERRPPHGIWGGLWSLPELPQARIGEWCQRVVGGQAHDTLTLEPLSHSFTHFDLDIQPVVVRLGGIQAKVAEPDDGVWYSFGATPPGGIAAPVQKLIDSVRTLDDVANH